MVFISSPKCNAASFCHESPIILHTKFNKLQNITFVLIPKPFTINGFSLNKFAMKSDCFLCNSLPAALRVKTNARVQAMTVPLKNIYWV